MEENKNVAFEFMGTHFHGHPSMWEHLNENEHKDHPLYHKWLNDLQKWKEVHVRV